MRDLHGHPRGARDPAVRPHAVQTVLPGDRGEGESLLPLLSPPRVFVDSVPHPKNSLVNVDLWKVIQKHYPRECKLRASGQEAEEVADDCQPVRLLSKPGELRREYEEEISKVEAERRASEEEENKASEEYIHRLLAEEEEEEKRQAEKGEERWKNN